MKKVIQVQYVFRRDFRIRQEVNDEIKRSISFIKYDIQISIENNISGKKRQLLYLHGDELKNCSL